VKQQEKFFRVADQVFEQFPGYVRGVVIVHGLTNRKSPDELIALLRAEEDSIRKHINLERLAEHPRIAPWREAYRSFGAKPAKFRPSIEAMVRRVLRDEPLPSINALVDIGNAISLRHLAPAGGHAIDVIDADMELRFANGDEEFTPLDAEQIEHPLPGEIIFAEGKTVLTRRWTWRQGTHTLISALTTAAEFNVDGLPPVPPEEVQIACNEIAELIERFCGGRSRCEMVSAQNPRVKL